MYDLEYFKERLNLDSEEMNKHAYKLLKILDEHRLYTVKEIMNSKLAYDICLTQYLWVCNLYYVYIKGEKQQSTK